MASLLAVLVDAALSAIVKNLPTIIGMIEQAIARGKQAADAKAKEATDDAAIDKAVDAVQPPPAAKPDPKP